MKKEIKKVFDEPDLEADLLCSERGPPAENSFFY